MKFTPHKYLVVAILLFGSVLFLNGQTSSNATVTIVGGDPNENVTVEPSSNPPEGGQIADPQNIEPTLENGFHIRYRIDTPQKEEAPAANEYASLSSTPGGSTGSYSGSSGGVKVKKKHIATMSERSFNLKKRLNAWMPKRKKKYRPNICGRF
ncbi:MAG TPA: hypothetical protein VFF27_09200 [Bacteroidia bacterium]|nr:hypothetical protein [Bacteroidia bacterium]